MSVSKSKNGNVLNKVKIEGCDLCQNAEIRGKHQDSEGYCSAVKSTDGLGVRCVGGWGADKAFFLRRYAEKTGIALKYRWKYVYYIEICSGPGLCVNFQNGEQFDGTALAVLKTKGSKYYSKLFFFDNNPTTVEILRQRVAQSSKIPEEVKEKIVISVGDYNDTKSIMDVLNQNIPLKMRGLNVIFIDPTDLSVPFDLFESLMTFGSKTDFIINFAYGTDLKRNIVRAFNNPDYNIRKKYEKVLNTPAFFEDPVNKQNAKVNENGKLCEAYINTFLDAFREKGYTFILETNILQYYKLLYISSNNLGKKFWDEASDRLLDERENGQGLLF